MVSGSTPPAGASAGFAPSAPARGRHATPAASPLTGYSSAHLLISDIRAFSIVANHARYWALGQFGVQPQDVNIATFAIALTLADSLPGSVKRLIHAPGRPDRIDDMFALGLINELVHDVAGPASCKTRNFGGLVAIGLLAGLSGPTVRNALRELHVVSGRAGGEFHHRYGYLIAARARRAARRAEADARAAAESGAPEGEQLLAAAEQISAAAEASQPAADDGAPAAEQLLAAAEQISAAAKESRAAAEDGVPTAEEGRAEASEPAGAESN